MSNLVAVPMYTQSGEAHGLINIMTNSVENNDFKHMAPHIKAILEKEKKEDAKLVKIKYHNKKGNHERLDKPYCRYAGDPIQIWHLIPGYIYEVPMGMVKEIQGVKKVKRSGLVSEDGKPMKKDESPLDQDVIEDGDHLIYPATF